MELIKKGSSAETSDNSATVTAENTGWFGTFGEREEINEREQSQPIYTWQSNTDVTRRLLFISIAVGTTAFLTAIAALVLALVMMKSNTFNTSSTFPTDHGALQGASELEKNVQEMKRNLSVVREYSGKNTAELWLILNGTVHQKFFDFQKQILKLDQKVDQEFKRIRQDVKQTEGSLLDKTNASLQEFENKVTNRFGKLELRVKMEEEKSSNIEKNSDRHSELIQHLTNMLNDTREDMRNMSQEQSMALELAQNSTVRELLGVRMLVNSTQTILLTQLKKVHKNMTEKVTKETEKLEARIKVEGNKSNSTKQVTDQNLNRIQQIEKLLNITRENMKEESKKYFSALWLAGNSTKTDLQSISMVLNATRGNIVRQLKEVRDNLTEQVKNVRKIPGPIGPSGYNGSQGPVGPQGVPGPAGPKGSGDLRQCQLETKSETKIAGSNRILVHVDEPTNKRIMAATCSTDHGTEYNLVSRVQSGNVRRYVCVCDGKSILFNGGSSCYLHYWICPLTT